MRIITLASALVAIAALAACQPAPAAKSVEEKSAAAESAPALGAFTTAARITSITDAGYPMYVVAAQLPDRATPVELLLNAADADLAGSTHEAFIGKDVTLAYEVVAENDLFDLREGDLSLVPDAPARAADWKEVTGALSGAETATGGDLPDLIAVTPANGAKVEFLYFITPQIAAANGKEVTAWYAPGATQYVRSLRLAEPSAP